MSSDVILRMTGKQKRALREHLFPTDGREAVALALCGRRTATDRHCLSVSRVELVPYEQCERRDDGIRWPTERLATLLAEAARRGMAVVKFHSHPGGFDQFSACDNASDQEFFEAANVWCEDSLPHGSVVMLPCGRMFGRTQRDRGAFIPLELISVAGDEVEFWFEQEADFLPDYTDRHAQVLGESTVSTLRRLRAAVIGCSGTGSPNVEQLFRLGVGELVLVDPDTVGAENLNRILNSWNSDGRKRHFKVDVLCRAVQAADLGTDVTTIPHDLLDPKVVEQVALCDVIFGCVDSVFARHVLNKLASTYCIPYVDIGVGLKADGKGGISHISGAIHYLQPDGSSLLSRGAFTLAAIQADALRRSDSHEHAKRAASGYIEGAEVARPAVISVNMVFAGLGVLEFLNRLHPMRDEPNGQFAMQRISLSHNLEDVRDDGERCLIVSRHIGQGDMRPLLGMPELSPRSELDHDYVA